jgi:hypothetical protein
MLLGASITGHLTDWAGADPAVGVKVQVAYKENAVTPVQTDGDGNYSVKINAPLNEEVTVIYGGEGRWVEYKRRIRLEKDPMENNERLLRSGVENESYWKSVARSLALSDHGAKLIQWVFKDSSNADISIVSKTRLAKELMTIASPEIVAKASDAKVYSQLDIQKLQQTSAKIDTQLDRDLTVPKRSEIDKSIPDKIVGVIIGDKIATKTPEDRDKALKNVAEMQWGGQTVAIAQARRTKKHDIFSYGDDVDEGYP